MNNTIVRIGFIAFLGGSHIGVANPAPRQKNSLSPARPILFYFSYTPQITKKFWILLRIPCSATIMLKFPRPTLKIRLISLPAGILDPATRYCFFKFSGFYPDNKKGPISSPAKTIWNPLLRVSIFFYTTFYQLIFLLISLIEKNITKISNNNLT